MGLSTAVREEVPRTRAVSVTAVLPSAVRTRLGVRRSARTMVMPTVDPEDVAKGDSRQVWTIERAEITSAAPIWRDGILLNAAVPEPVDGGWAAKLIGDRRVVDVGGRRLVARGI